MKLEIFSESEENKEQIVRLALEQDDDSVYLVSKDNNGDIMYWILEILPDGRFHKSSGLGAKCGLSVGANNKIKEKV